MCKYKKCLVSVEYLKHKGVTREKNLEIIGIQVWWSGLRHLGASPSGWVISRCTGLGTHRPEPRPHVWLLWAISGVCAEQLAADQTMSVCPQKVSSEKRKSGKVALASKHSWPKTYGLPRPGLQPLHRAATAKSAAAEPEAGQGLLI